MTKSTFKASRYDINTTAHQGCALPQSTPWVRPLTGQASPVLGTDRFKISLYVIQSSHSRDSSSNWYTVKYFRGNWVICVHSGDTYCEIHPIEFCKKILSTPKCCLERDIQHSLLDGNTWWILLRTLRKPQRVQEESL